MEPALDVINRALLGDPDACSFLERTTSVFVLDVTDVSNPKTYGSWNFIHQAMNEVERRESRYLKQETNGGTLVGHARMLASMALQGARRSPFAVNSISTAGVSGASRGTTRRRMIDASRGLTLNSIRKRLSVCAASLSSAGGTKGKVTACAVIDQGFDIAISPKGAALPQARLPASR